MMKKAVLVTAVVFHIACASLGVRITVPDDFQHIQDAIDAVGDYDIVRVRDGVYDDARDCDLDFGGKAITVESKDGPANCIINCAGSKLNPRRGFYFHSGEDANSVVNGFTIINGYASGYDAFGGAIRCEPSLTAQPSSPTITNCIIKNNSATSDYSVAFGGGIYCDRSSPVISNCTISANIAGNGGGIYCADADPNISDCVISDNQASDSYVGIAGSYGYGGAIDATDGSAPTIQRCTIIGNSALFGGGVSSYDPASPGLIVYDSTISNNSALEYGGGLQLEASALEAFYRAQIKNCTISGNYAINNGGGIESINYSAVIENCLITANVTRDYSGGAIDCYASSPSITNCTISGNESINGVGGGLNCEADLAYLNGSVPAITNCVFHQNTGWAINEWDSYSDAQTIYCLFYDNPQGDYMDYETGLQTGPNNINANIAEAHDNVGGDPLFVMNGPNSITGTWKLSPDFNAGTNRTTFTDWTASFVPGQLAGRHINPNTANTYEVFITGNTDTTIEVVGNLSADVSQGDTYLIVDYHLQSGSVCIDFGTSSGAPSTDIEKSPRPVNVPGMGPYVMADLDGDSTVDCNDLVVMFDNWLRDDCLSASCDGADIAPASGPDGIVNLADYSLLLDNWHRSGTVYDIGAYEFQAP